MPPCVCEASRLLALASTQPWQRCEAGGTLFVMRPSEDTHPAAASVQLDLLRRAPVHARARVMRSLSTMVIELSRRALRDRMPGASDSAVAIRWLELHYGEDIAARVARRLEADGR